MQLEYFLRRRHIVALTRPVSPSAIALDSFNIVKGGMQNWKSISPVLFRTLMKLKGGLIATLEG
jgi:hypothetical protein